MYTFSNTEINYGKATELETKAMLYLLGMREDSDAIDVVTIDCFNDVTGADEKLTKLWDVQSKNHKSLPPSKIGESLLTLYKNSVSNFPFCDYVLFIPKLERKYLENDQLRTYKYSNIKQRQRNGIERKLIEKITGDLNGARPSKLDSFLSKVTFSEDIQSISAYIKTLSKFKKKESIPDEIYVGIFNEIRAIQSALKNSYIENLSIRKPPEVLRLNRHLTKSQIHSMLIGRLVGIDDVFSHKGIPIAFIGETRGLNDEEIKDLLDDCNGNLSRAFFDKNDNVNFWNIAESVISTCKKIPSANLQQTYDEALQSVAIGSSYLNPITIKYLISLVKQGLEQ